MVASTDALALVPYPVNDFGPAMKGMVIGGLGIFHVFLAQFAIGGGMLLTWFQWLAMRGKEPLARTLLDSYFRVLILVSFVVGALTGVGMWFTSIQVSPRTIGTMIDTFHWVWATEWIFFWVEVVAGYAVYRYGRVLSDRAKLGLLITYSVAGWGSLFWINGILSWQLTPGEWVASRDIWAGFFNPTFWPSLGYRTVACIVIAGLIAAIIINAMPDLTRIERERLVRRAGSAMAAMLVMPVFGIWFLVVLPPDSREWVLGGSAAMTMFMNIAVGASVLVGGYAIVALWRQKLFVNGATATLLAALAFGATAGGEFVREGVRKPFTIRETLYSNSIAPDEVARIREVGLVTNNPFPLRDGERYPSGAVATGALVFREQCAVCHTIGGVNGLLHLMGTWSIEQQRMNVAKLQLTKPFMPPFAGTAEEVDALVQYVRWEKAERPKSWGAAASAEELARIRAWLEEAGPHPATARREAAR